jgi:hypothetical protein
MEKSSRTAKEGLAGTSAEKAKDEGFVHGALDTSKPSDPTQTPISAVTVVSLI